MVILIVDVSLVIIFLFDRKQLKTNKYTNSGTDNRTDALGPTLQPTDLLTEKMFFGLKRKYS